MNLIILGAGGHGQTVADIARQSGNFDKISFLDDNAHSAGGLGEVLGKCSDYLKFKDKNTQMYPAFGNNEARLEWEDKLQKDGIELALIVHPLSYISPTAHIANGCVIMPFAVVNTLAHIKKGCIINCSALVDHGNILEEGCHIGPGAIVKAENRVPKCTKLDAGEIITIRQFKI